MLARIKFELSALAKEIVDKLPPELFTSSTTTFLDPAMAGGQFLVEIIRRLKDNGHDDVNIATRVFGLAEDKLDLNYAQRKNGVFGQLAVGGIETLENYKNMGKKFDVVIMNPPYNDERSTASPTSGERRNKGTLLHLNFIEMGLSLAEVVAVVCPLKGWFVGKERSIKKDLIDNKQIQYINMITGDNAQRLFGAKTGHVGILVLKSSGVDETTVCIDNKLLAVQPAGTNIEFNEHTPLLNKILGSANTVGSRLNNGSGPTRSGAAAAHDASGAVQFVEIIGPRGDPIHITMCNSLLEDPSSRVYDKKQGRYRLDVDVNKCRVGINQNGEPFKLGAMKIIPAGVVTSYSVSTLTTASETEAANLITYLNCKVPKFCISQSHQSQSIGQNTFRYVPEIDLSRSWTDAELYQHFNLTQEEIDLIEATVK